jgi:hypothetical protein
MHFEVIVKSLVGAGFIPPFFEIVIILAGGRKARPYISNVNTSSSFIMKMREHFHRF